jgi:putative ABC transport system ATP-binding protein
MIRTRGLAYRYGAGPLLNFADVDVTQGGTLLVRGRSGSGKSTWLALVAGLRGATGGDLLVGGIHIGPQRAAELDAWRARCIGFVPQKLHLSSALTVADNLALAYFAAGRKRDDAAIAQALDQLGVGELAHRKPHQLSGGQAQRVALARAVLLQPELLLADEPTASLDDEAAAVALSLLQSSAARCGASLVIATHDQRVVQALAAVPRLQTLDLNAGRAAGQAMPGLNEMPTLGSTDKR